jgi:hypothetical protein
VNDRFTVWSAAFWRGVLVLFFALTALILVEESRAVQPALEADAAVRVRVPTLAVAWLEGKVFPTRPGCTMVRLRERSASGHEAVSLRAVEQLERATTSGWTALPVAPLLAREPSPCMEGDND